MEAKTKRGTKKKTPLKMHQLMGVSPDPCTYTPSSLFASNSLVGVEIELERVRTLKIADNGFYEYWQIVEDGSLRDGGMEYVLSRPFSGKDLETALKLFDKNVAKSGKQIRAGRRTSVHVHIDIRDLTFDQLMKFVCIYSIFEESLFKLVGEERSNNIFATSFSNAEGELKQLGRFGDSPNRDEARAIFSVFTKYSACNLAAVQKYGSLEFRNHEGTYDISRIIKWINILMLMKEAAISLEIPTEEILSSISQNGAEAFFLNVFQEYSDELRYDTLEYDMFNGLRLVQDVLYYQQLTEGVKLPKLEKGDKGCYAQYYKRRKPKRYKDRYKEFMKHVGGSTTSFETDNAEIGVAGARRGFNPHAGFAQALREHQAQERIEIGVVDNSTYELNLDE